jgi:hypothetical protein
MKRDILFFGLSCLVGCGGAGSPDAPTQADADTGIAAEAGSDAGGSDAKLDASSESSLTDGCVAAAKDDPDDMAADSNCDGADGVVGVDVYVNAATGGDTNIGTPTKPMGTIERALALAATRGGKVLLAGGPFEVATLDQPGTWTLYGGYDATFTKPPRRELTILRAPATGLLVDLATDAGLVHVTVQGAAASDAAFPSAYGVRNKALKLRLDDVALQASDALAGAAGTTGAAGTNGLLGVVGANVQGTPPSLDCVGTDAPVTLRGTSAGSAGGGGALPGDVTLVPPRIASPGGAGRPGTDGGDAAKLPSITAGFLRLAPGGVGKANGTGGYAGAGGGSATFVASYPNVLYVYGGGGGSGGCPGLGGGGGASGGSSVALLVLSGEVEISRSSLTTGSAGSGGDGGPGGPGGLGGGGGQAAAERGSTPVVLPPQCLTSSDDPLKLNCAEYGAAGGPGGPGGRGGGGAGGWSIGVATGGSSTANVDAATTTTLGRAGDGGAGNGGGYAPAGENHATYKLP